MTDQPTLRDRIAQALEEADYRLDMRRGDLADAVMAVLPDAQRAATYQAAWQGARHRARVLSDELTRRAPLNGEYAAAASEAEARRLALSQALGLGTGAPWDAIQERAGELHLAPVDRAAVLREAADECDRRVAAVDALSSSDFGEEARAARELAAAATEFRRMADEAQQPEEAGW
ncbi:hypothetical protein ACFC0S_16965 [Streptomyces sp. NPDC056084]|uniref:hypothetical protein n=1 Tax=unclassified Streptomyces TaxID=2593676 RepID=UPI0035D868AE